MRDRLKLAGRVCAAPLAASMALITLPAHAAQVNGQFAVTVTLLSPTVRSAGAPRPENTAFCRTSPALAFGALVTVVCATGEVVDIAASGSGFAGAPVHGGTYRFMLPGSYARGLPDLYDGNTGYGTAATWRIVQLADRDYYELLMGW